MRNHRFQHSSHRQAVLSERAREMRQAPIPSEQVLWQAIRGGRLGVQFRRHVVLGHYIADFFAAEVALIVEVDGGYHGRLRERSDERRDRWLRRRGYTVLRLSDAFVVRNMGVAVELIAEQVAALRR
jgi:very-short-patch-repair endonuclease